MISRNATICNKLGLHARAAGVFVKLATNFAAEISVNNQQRTANGKSIMSMMMLEASIGTQIEISAEGDDESEAVEALIQLIEDRFGEAE